MESIYAELIAGFEQEYGMESYSNHLPKSDIKPKECQPRVIRSYTTTQIIAKEGWNQIAIALMVFLCAYALSFMTWAFFALLVFTILFYRNPERLDTEEDSYMR